MRSAVLKNNLRGVMEKIYMVYVTASGKNEAKIIAKEIVFNRLAACANVSDKIDSFYWWENKFEEKAEAAIIFKTRESLLWDLEQEIKNIHSYSCPCIVAMPIEYVSKEYAEWVIRETS